MIKDIMDLIRGYYYSATKQELLITLAGIEAFFTLPFMICSFVVAGTANAGFNCVLTGFLNAGLAGGSYYVIKNSKSPIAVGFLLGSSSMMSILNLMTSIYWGQLSGCKIIHGQLAGYTCTNHSAYGAVCAFAIFLFLTQLVFSVALYWWHGELIIDAGGSYDDLPQSNSAHSQFTYAAPPLPTAPQQQQQQQYSLPSATSADL